MIELIKKLMAMTEENGCTASEAMMAVDKISRLRDKYNISMEEINTEEFEAIGEVVETGYKRVPGYLEILACELGACFDVKVVISHKHKGKFILVGLEQDVLTTKHFFIYLSRVLISEAKGKKNKNAYCFGIIEEICNRLKPQENKAQSTGTDLTVCKASAIRKYIAAEFGRTTSKTSNIGGTQDDISAGKQRGKNISLSKPMSSKNNPTKKLTT